MPMAAHAGAARTVWSRNSTSVGGFDGTALVQVGGGESAAATAAADIAVALEAKMGRIVVSLPRYGTLDAGASFLAALAAECAPEPDPQDVPGESSEINPEEYVRNAREVSAAIAATDLVITYDESMPLLGMHGMSGTAALLGDVDPAAAQYREKDVSGLFHALLKILDDPHAPSASHAGMGLGLSAPSRGVLPSRAADIKDLSRHDAAGSAGGIGFALLLAGARALPLSQAFGAQFGVHDRVTEADVVVVYQDELDSRTFPTSTAGLIAPIALRVGVPCIVITRDRMMSTRELAAQGIASSYQLEDAHELGSLAARLAKSWSPAR